MSFARWLCLSVIVALACAVPRRAFAQVSLEMQLSSREVAVGDSLQVQLEAMSSDGESPSAPELLAPPSFDMRGPSVGTRQQVSISGFNMVTQTGISATWLLTPTRPGLYSIGPGSVMAQGRRQQADPIQIRVLPEGQRPRAPARRSPLDRLNRRDPFGGGTFDDLFDQLRGGGARFDQLPDAPVELIPQSATDPLAFLSARVDPPNAVVGQQVTLSIYAHGSRGMFQEAPGGREPSHPDFLAQRMVEDSSRQPRYQYSRDEQTWVMVKVRETALFPLRAGRLEIGPLELGLLGRSYGARSGQGLRRQSPTLLVDVASPPLAGRLPGFTGDVGQFELSAVVEPLRVPVGGSVAVTARVDGTGRLPGALKLPEQSGVEWLEPTVRDEVTTTGTTLGGSRTFNYIVRLSQPGELDLGTLSLPHYDPDAKVYRMAARALGRVQVEAGAAPPPGSPPAAAADAPAREGPQLSEWVKFRPLLEPRATASHWADRRGFWWLIAAGPLLVALSAALVRLRARLRAALSRRDQSQATHAGKALAAAREALAAAAFADVASAAERAIYSAVEWATGLKVRAFLRSELGPALVGAGLDEALSQRTAELLARAAELRVGGADTARAAELVRDVEALVKRLVQRPPATVRASSAAATLCVLMLASGMARADSLPADGPSPDRLAKLQAELARGAFSEVIDELELWSDRGEVQADLSFNRGVAYLGRAESSAARRADWGQAAAAFEEALHLNPADDEARNVLGRIREKIAERRAQANAGVVARPPLLRALIGLLGENVWAALALLGSLVATLGLAVRLYSNSPRAHLGGGVGGVIGAFVLLLGGSMTFAARHLREAFSPAVVIVEEARLLDAGGRPFSGERGSPSARGGAGDRVPEGWLVHVAETEGPLARVEWGDSEAWLATREIRILVEPN